MMDSMLHPFRSFLFPLFSNTVSLCPLHSASTHHPQEPRHLLGWPHSARMGHDPSRSDPREVDTPDRARALGVGLRFHTRRTLSHHCVLWQESHSVVREHPRFTHAVPERQGRTVCGFGRVWHPGHSYAQAVTGKVDPEMSWFWSFPPSFFFLLYPWVSLFHIPLSHSACVLIKCCYLMLLCVL